jgi:hypothetical protein
MPKGFREKPGGDMRVAVRFDSDELFEQIKLRALHEKRTFSEMVCELCKIGLFDLEESERHDEVA